MRYLLLGLLMLTVTASYRPVNADKIDVIVLVIEDSRTNVESNVYPLRSYVEKVRQWLNRQCDREVFLYNIVYITPSPSLTGAADLWQWGLTYQEEHSNPQYPATYWIFGVTGGALLGAGTGMAIVGDWTLRSIYDSIPPFLGEGGFLEAAALPGYQYRRAASAAQLVYALANGWGPVPAFDMTAWPDTALSDWHKERICQR